jgi:uncharacterized membrane protein
MGNNKKVPGGVLKGSSSALRRSRLVQFAKERTRTMTPRILPGLSETAHALEHRYGVGGLKRGILVMFSGWIAYFVAVNMFIRSLNKVIVPVLDMPLGNVLAMQGAVVIFVVALVVLTKWRSATTATVRIRSRRAGR